MQLLPSAGEFCVAAAHWPSWSGRLAPPIPPSTRGLVVRIPRSFFCVLRLLAANESVPILVHPWLKRETPCVLATLHLCVEIRFPRFEMVAVRMDLANAFT
jgi:hypothetical protein